MTSIKPKNTYKKINHLKTKDFILIYCTVPDQKSGQILSQHLLSKNLIACANLFPEGTSFYKWKGKLEKQKENILIFKTKKSYYSQLEKEIKKIHPYKCPCILSLTLTKAHTPFLKWIEKQLL